MPVWLNRKVPVEVSRQVSLLKRARCVVRLFASNDPQHLFGPPPASQRRWYAAQGECGTNTPTVGLRLPASIWIEVLSLPIPGAVGKLCLRHLSLGV